MVISQGATLAITRSYAAAFGSLTITLYPGAPSRPEPNGARTEDAWLASGVTRVLPTGPHEVEYSPAANWIAPSNELITINLGVFTSITRVYVLNPLSDTDNDGLLDSWEVRWFGNLSQGGAGDPDNDGLSNLEEQNAGLAHPNLSNLSPMNWDSDGDGMDDKWEYDDYASGNGLNPTVNDAYGDVDGDGLVNVQEYFGVDGAPRLEQDPAQASGIAKATGSADDLNPLDVDTDGDGLIDSYEAAWYDPVNSIDPKAAGNLAAEPDQDGMTSYREQCLLAEFQEGGPNIWSNGTNDLPRADTDGIRAFNVKLQFGATNSPSILMSLDALRGVLPWWNEWTDPSHGSGYWVDQPVDGSDGWDTDRDLLPDGWEVEFALNPKNPFGNDGFWGDPDNDGLLNTVEFYGQDGDRDPILPYINGTGDETNPNEHNWRLGQHGCGPRNPTAGHRRQLLGYLPARRRATERWAPPRRP